ncbi:MAG: SpoIIE family protein phosphatase [bacterium]|nr:SpoIIE family protein phosphatase [bacterium]
MRRSSPVYNIVTACMLLTAGCDSFESFTVDANEGHAADNANRARSSEADVFSLKGEWRYRVLDGGASSGDDVASEAEYATKIPDAAVWNTIEVPFDAGQSPEFIKLAGCLQLRRALPASIVERARRSAFALDSGHTSDVARFYINDPKTGMIGGFGNEPLLAPGDYATGHDGRLVQIIPAAALQSGVNEFYAEVCTRPGKPLFWRGARILIGPADEIFDSFAVEVAVAFGLAALYVSIGLYHLLLALRRPRDIFNLYFGVFALAFASFHLANTSGAEMIYGSAKELQSKVDQVSLMIFAASLLLFLSRFFLNRHSRVAIALSSLYVLFAALDLFVPHSIRLALLEVLIYTMVFALPYILFLTGREAWNGNRDARLLLIGVALIVCGAVHDILVERRVIQSILLMPFAFLAFITGIALILANRFVRVHSEVEEFAAELEDKVRRRTADLQASLNEVRELKDKQDGDYFLTAQLLQPLAGNYARRISPETAPPVDAEYLSRQKKTFRFRHREGELGGDLCAIHSLRLRERDVLVFFNGDAMGKSMQGAGGALIMGTVFKTIITRTQKSAKIQASYPEQWLRQCYQELQSVLLAFDGRMLISMVVGIVDEETGMLYFVNAEHPHVVLLRAGAAEFVQEKGILCKLGVDDPAEVFVVQTLPLQENDVVLIGSDGRDDLQIGTNPDGLAIINEDERAFLSDVERSHGRLENLELLIRERGAVTDDLSLIRIAYREDAAALDEAIPAHDLGLLRDARDAYRGKDYDRVVRVLEPLAKQAGLPPEPLAGNAAVALASAEPIAFVERKPGREVLRMLLRAYIETEDFPAATRVAEAYTNRVPEDNEVLLWHSFVLRRIAEHSRAIDVGERLFMRDPENLRNLKHLARLHLKFGSPERGRYLDSLHATGASVA